MEDIDIKDVLLAIARLERIEADAKGAIEHLKELLERNGGE